MTHRYTQRIERVLKPYEYEKDNRSSCHTNLSDSQIEYLNRWHNQLHLDGKSEATRSDYLEKASIFLRRTDKPIEEIDKNDAIGFLADKSEGGRRTYKATLRQFFLWFYLYEKEIPENELPRFINNQLKVKGQAGKNKVKKEDVPTEEEVKKLLKTAWNHRDRALIAILADKGMRISEALALEIKDVNFDPAGIYLMVPEAKKNYESYRKNRLTWSRPALKDWLENHPRRNEENAPLFVKLQNRQDEEDYQELKYDAARHMLEKLKKRASVENITLHKFRHYSTTKDRQKKHMRDSFIVKDKGWDDPSMLERYDHLTENEVDIAHIKQMVEDGQLEKSVLEEIENGNGSGETEVTLELIRCPNCNHPNSPERDYCDQCNQPFNGEGIEKQERLKGLVRDAIEQKGLLEELEAEVNEI